VHCAFVVDDVLVEFKGSCLSLDVDQFSHEPVTDENLLLKTVSSKIFAEQLTCKDAVSCTVCLCAGFEILVYVPHVYCVWRFIWISLVKNPECFAEVSESICMV